MPQWKKYAVGWAIFLAVTMHLLLFIAVRPADGESLSSVLIPPKTSYLFSPIIQTVQAGGDIRSVGSPVLFSLPSPLGFSRELMQDNLRTRLTFAQPTEVKSFLEMDSMGNRADGKFSPERFMVSAPRFAALRAPGDVFSPSGLRSSARRVYFVPELKRRLSGGVVLPPSLSQPVLDAWEVRAEVNLSKQGRVRHVFLAQPLESVALNQSILQWLYGLRFEPGEQAVEGHIEIYSPIDGGGSL